MRTLRLTILLLSMAGLAQGALGPVKYHPTTLVVSPTNIWASNSTVIGSAVGSAFILKSGGSGTNTLLINPTSSNPVLTNATIYPSNYARMPLIVYGNSGIALTVNSNGNVVEYNALQVYRPDNNAAIGAFAYGGGHIQQWSISPGETSSYTNIAVLSTDSNHDGYFQINDRTATSKVLLDADSPGYYLGGNFGIGTNNPGSRLSAANIVANGDVAMELANDAQRWKWELYGTDADKLRLYDITKSKEALTIYAGGNVTAQTNLTAMTNLYVGGTVWPTNGIKLPTPVWDDVRIPLQSLSSPSSAPGKEAFVGGIYAYAFDKDADEQLMFECQVPHGIDTNNAYGIRLHVHYSGITAPTEASNIVWGIEYVVANPNTSFPLTTTTIYATNGLTVATNHQMAVFYNYITNVTESAVIVGRLFRDANNAADEYGGDAYGLSLDAHYPRNAMGSVAEYGDY